MSTDNNFGLYHVLKAEQKLFSHSPVSRVQSEDSMEHLSAEERACLMYLEETIEALEVQEDSGLSNDEPDCLTQGGMIDQAGVRGRWLFCPDCWRRFPLMNSHVLECSSNVDLY